MPFLNSLVDPYGVLARDTYGEDNDEDWRNRRPTQRVSAAAASPPATPPGDDGGRGGRGGRGDFLASLAQMGPLIAQIFQSTATGDSIQRALADHASTMERYNESRRIQMEREKERAFAAEQSSLQRQDAINDREDRQRAQVDLANARNTAENERFTRRLDADKAARKAALEADAAAALAERQDVVRQKLGLISAHNKNADPNALLDENGNLTVEGEANYQLALIEQEAQAAKARRVATEENRQATPAELMLEAAEARRDQWMTEWDDLSDTIKVQFKTPDKYVNATYGEGSWESTYQTIAYRGSVPEPVEPAGAVLDRVLSDASSPEYTGIVSELANAPNFEAEIQSLLQGVARPEELLKKIEKALPESSPNKAVVKRLLYGTTTRFEQGVNRLFEPVKGVSNNPLVSGARAAFGGLFEPIPRDGNN